MKLISFFLHKSGLFTRLQEHFLETLLMNCAVRCQISMREARFLAEITKDLRTPGPIVEIGTLFGRSTRAICTTKEANREFLTVDNFFWNPCGLSKEQHSGLTHAILQDCIETEHLRLVEMNKNDFYENYDGPSPAMAFFDADHCYEETLKDIQWAQSVQAKVICGHDYSEEWPGVIEAVEECGGAKQIVQSLWLLN